MTGRIAPAAEVKPGDVVDGIRAVEVAHVPARRLVTVYDHLGRGRVFSVDQPVHIEETPALRLHVTGDAAGLPCGRC